MRQSTTSSSNKRINADDNKHDGEGGKLDTSTSSSSSRRGQENGDSNSTSSSSGNIEWEKWRPWFRADCSLCRKEVEELIQQQQQKKQERQQQGGLPSSWLPQSSATASAAMPESGLGTLPWDFPYKQQQQQQEEREAAAAADEGSRFPSQFPSSSSAEAEAAELGCTVPGQYPPTSSSAAAAEAAGRVVGDEPNLHGSCYGSWPVPWDCPFKFRRLMWRLMARVKPTALRFWGEVIGLCPHCPDDVQMWQSFVSGEGQWFLKMGWDRGQMALPMEVGKVSGYWRWDGTMMGL
jgi:hypothetical protein